MSSTGSDAASRFLATLLGQDGTEKTAVSLEPETADALGIPSVSPSTLDELESEAGSTAAAEDEVASAQESGAQEQATEVAEVPSFDSADTEPTEERAPEPELPSRATHGKLFSDRRAHPLQLLNILDMRYKGAWPEWEPDTLWWAIRRDFGPVGELTRNKVQALVLAVSTDVPWLDWDVFENSGLAWNDVMPIFGAFQPMSPMQAAFTVQTLGAIREDQPFAAEVNVYLAAILEEHGWVYAPEEWFAGAQNLIDRKAWLLGFKSEVADAWAKLQDIDPQAVDWREENPLDVHIVKMLVVKRYLQERAELHQGIPGISDGSATVSPPVP